MAGNYFSIHEIMTEILKDKKYYDESNGGVTLSGGEVLGQYRSAIQLLDECKMNNIHTASETSGYAPNNIFKEFISHIDLLLIDVKHYDNTLHKSLTGADFRKIKRNIESALAIEKTMLVRIPVIPNFNDSLDDAKKFSILFNEMGIDKVELLPFHQLGKNKYSALKRIYPYANVKALNSEDLLPYQRVLSDNGITCLLS